MQRFFILPIILLIAGCSSITEYYEPTENNSSFCSQSEDGEWLGPVKRKATGMFAGHPDKSYAAKGAMFGIVASWTSQSYIPELKAGYFNLETAAASVNHDIKITKDYEDVSLLKAAGDIKTELEVTRKSIEKKEE